MIQNICVFCSSSDVLADVYKNEAENMADLLLESSIHLIYGGARVGLMGLLANKIIEGNGKVTGVIPELIYSKNIHCSNLTELIVTPDMKSRKAKMAELAHAFVALPGGFGTLEELVEVITLKQLDYHQKPIVIVNTAGFYDKLIELFEVFYTNEFAKSDYKFLYHIANNSLDAMEYIKNYKPTALASKWYIANLNI